MEKLDYAAYRLFNKEKLDVNNIKLFPGHSRDVSVEDFSSEITKSLAQIEAGDYEEVFL
jgi:hypothetical protein